MTKTSTFLLFLALSFGAFSSEAQNANAGNKTAQVTTTGKLTIQERDSAVRLLTQTESGVFDAVKGLSAEQLAFKPAADKWSIEECLKHIAASETSLWAMVDESLNKPANPEKKAEIKMTDAALVTAVEDRSHKSKTFAMLEPANSPYKTTAEALAAFKENRSKLIAFVKSTEMDLRSHISVLPIGTYDAYQFILLIAAHSNRHTQQVEEVKAVVGFP